MTEKGRPFPTDSTAETSQRRKDSDWPSTDQMPSPTVRVPNITRRKGVKKVPGKLKMRTNTTPKRYHLKERL